MHIDPIANQNNSQPSTDSQNDEQNNVKLSQDYSRKSSSKSNVSYQEYEAMEHATSLQDNINKTENNRNNDKNNQSKNITINSKKISPSKSLSNSFKKLYSDSDTEIEEIVDTEIKKNRPPSYGKFKEKLLGDKHSSKIQNENTNNSFSEKNKNQKIKDRITSIRNQSSVSLNSSRRTYFRTKRDTDAIESSDEELNEKSPLSQHISNQTEKGNSNIISKVGSSDKEIEEIVEDSEIEEFRKNRPPPSYGKFKEKLLDDKHSSKIQIENTNNSFSEKNKIKDRITSARNQSSVSLNNSRRTYFRTKRDTDTTESSDEELHEKSPSSHHISNQIDKGNTNNLPKGGRSKTNINLKNNLNKEDNDNLSPVHREKLLNISNRTTIDISKQNNDENLMGQKITKRNLTLKSFFKAKEIEEDLNSNNGIQSENLEKPVQQLFPSSENALGQSSSNEKKSTQLSILKFLEHQKKLKEKMEREIKEKYKSKYVSEPTIPPKPLKPPTKIRQLKKLEKKSPKDDDFRKINDRNYKPPKIKPPRWIQNQPDLQSRIFSVLSNNYEEEIANRKNEEVIELLANVVKKVTAQKKIIDYTLIDKLKLKLAQEKIVHTTYEFHWFVLEYCPHQFIIRVVPMKPYSRYIFDPPFDAETIGLPIITEH
ncbi:uncharacterized protein DDB_G0288805-like [Chrysoperla carnea]|uniref:uncharacterized protein DDB_G0288805-like n=1 Tax=Chrysoperla carnea TaxID=189513 RepID=UPI001D075B4F|nr:uncharacterized protein DDB_G0288805-like [Chrysoperla carnea]